jgi:hypothetical protein
MTNVMLGGSRHLTNLPQVVVDKLIDHMNANVWFLVGDAIGADSLFQKFLHQKKYLRVVVFTSMEMPRNNYGKWEPRVIDSGLKSQSAAKHTVKDRKMVENADEGLMIWDNESPGTLANAIDFIDSEKSCFFWTPKDGHLWNIDSPKNLQSLLETNLEIAQESQKRLITYRKREEKKAEKPAFPGLFTE